MTKIHSEEELREVLSKHMSKDVTELLGISPGRVAKLRKSLGVKSPYHQEMVRKFTLNHRFFQTIDSEEKAYALGFFVADGNVNPDKYGCEIRICLHHRDVDILHKINSAWESTYQVKDHFLTKNSGFEGTNRHQVKLSVRSSDMMRDLAELGVTPAKTYSVRYPNIPDNLDRHFLRGFLDGDGHITRQEFGWVCNKGMANDIQRIGIKHGFGELRRYNIKEHSDCVKGGPKYHEMIKWMYEGSTIFLDRKKEKFDTWWKDRVYKGKLREYVSTKHIPCTLEALPPVLGSTP